MQYRSIKKCDSESGAATHTNHIDLTPLNTTQSLSYNRDFAVTVRRLVQSMCVGLCFGPAFFGGRALADGPLQHVHLRVGGKEVSLKVAPVADDQNTYVPIEALSVFGLDAKRDAKGELAHVVQTATQKSIDLAFARPNGVSMLSLTELAAFLNAHVVRSEIIGRDNKPIPGSLGDTVYLLARITDVRYQNSTLRINTSFPVPYQARPLPGDKANTSRIECIGAEVPPNVVVSSVTPPGAKEVKVRAKQYSLDTAHISVELPAGYAIARAESLSNASMLIQAEVTKSGKGPIPNSAIASRGKEPLASPDKPAPTNRNSVVIAPNGGPVPPADAALAGVQPPKTLDGNPGTSAGNGNPVLDPKAPGTVARTPGPQRATSPSRSGTVRRTTPVEIRAITLVAESDTRVHLDIDTSDTTGAFVHYLPGGKLAVDVQNALPHLNDEAGLDQKLNHPLLDGVHAELLQESPAITRITCDTSRIVGFTVTSQGGKISVDMRLPRNATGALADKVIVVDAGHGGSSTGATAGGFAEKNITLQIALRLREALEAAGAKVVMTRDRDVDVDLNARPALANDISADLFVSVHNDSFTSDARGTSTFYHMSDPSSRALANCVSQAVAAVSGIPSRGALSDGILYNSGLAVLRQSRMPAILVEVAFISNTQDRRKLVDGDFQQRVANAICGGVRAYIEGGTPTGGRRMGMEYKEAPPIPGDDLEKNSRLDSPLP